MYSSYLFLRNDLPETIENNGNEDQPKIRKPDSSLGLTNLPIELSRRALQKKDFILTIMAVGKSGLGKSTLINSMFLTDICEYVASIAPKTVSIEAKSVSLRENGINLLLTIVDTPGFGDSIDNTNCLIPIIEFLEKQHDNHLKLELGHSTPVCDLRVHCCLYFIQPTGHSLKPLDIQFMKTLSNKVNIIPVIAKADTLTPEERTEFKTQIMKDITENDIKIYEFPNLLGDIEEYKQNKLFKSKVPFAVMGANTVIEINGKKVRARKYAWGTAEVENLEHCDFVALKSMLLHKHLQDVIDVTDNVFYLDYKRNKLAQILSSCNVFESKLFCRIQNKENSEEQIEIKTE